VYLPPLLLFTKIFTSSSAIAEGPRDALSQLLYEKSQLTRRIALSCGIKISPVGSVDYLQSTRVTDGQTDRRTDGENYDSQDRANIAASRGKNHFFYSA